jgi:hypothetical protein
MNKNECPKIKIKDETNCNKFEMKQNTTKKTKVISYMKLKIGTPNVQFVFGNLKTLEHLKTFKVLRL